MTYRINVKTIAREQYLTFYNVKEFSVIDGFLTFTDAKTGKIKRFSTSNCEIEEEEAKHGVC